jgi:hypothetical protein
MSYFIDLAGCVIKTVSGARTASRAAGLDTPALEELHDGLSPVRAEFRHARRTTSPRTLAQVRGTVGGLGRHQRRRPARHRRRIHLRRHRVVHRPF